MRIQTETGLYTRKEKGAREKRKFLSHIALGVLSITVLTFVITAVWYGSRLEMFQIKTILVSGGESVSHGDIESRVARELDGSYLRLIPKRFAYLYPHDAIVALIARDSRLHSIEVDRPTLSELAITFEEYTPHALWCSNRSDLSCQFITANGYAFGEAPNLIGGALVRHIREDVDEVRAGESFDPYLLRSVETFMQKVEEEQALRITSVLYLKNGDIEFSVNGGGMILVSGKKNFDEAFENLSAVLSSEEYSHLEPGNFKYIDVRFENKVFVNEAVGQSGTDTATTTGNLPE